MYNFLNLTFHGLDSKVFDIVWCNFKKNLIIYLFKFQYIKISAIIKYRFKLVLKKKIISVYVY